MKSKIKIVIATTIMLFLISIKVYSLDGHLVHPFPVTGRSEELLKNTTDISANFYNYNDTIPNGYIWKDIFGIERYDESKITKKGTLGTIAADGTGWWDEWLELRAITGNHFYNPKTYKGLLYKILGIIPIYFDNAIIYGKDQWEKALYYCNNNDKTKGYYYLGWVLHLLQDMTSHGHVFAKEHVSLTSGYEEWVLKNYTNTSLYPSNRLNPSQPPANANPNGTSALC